MPGLDIAFLAIVGFGALIGFAQGFSGEVLSILKFVAAAIVTALVMQQVVNALPISGMMLDVVSGIIGAVVYFIASLVLGLITFQLNFILSAALPDAINKPVGIAFGSLKMFLMMSVGFYVGLNVYAKYSDKEPHWVEESVSKDVLYGTGEFLVGNFVEFKGGKKEKRIEGEEKSKGFGIPSLPDIGGLDALKSYMSSGDSEKDAEKEVEDDGEKATKSSGDLEKKLKDIDLSKTFDTLDSLLDNIEQ